MNPFNGFPVNFPHAFAYNPGFTNPQILGQNGQPFSPTPANAPFHPKYGNGIMGGPNSQSGAARLQTLNIPGSNDLEILENLKQMIKNGQHEFYRALPQPAALASLYLGPQRPLDQQQQVVSTPAPATTSTTTAPSQSTVPPHPQQALTQQPVPVKTEPQSTEELLRQAMGGGATFSAAKPEADKVRPPTKFAAQTAEHPTPSTALGNADSSTSVTPTKATLESRLTNPESRSSPAVAASRPPTVGQVMADPRPQVSQPTAVSANTTQSSKTTRSSPPRVFYTKSEGREQELRESLMHARNTTTTATAPLTGKEARPERGVYDPPATNGRSGHPPEHWPGRYEPDSRYDSRDPRDRRHDDFDRERERDRERDLSDRYWRERDPRDDRYSRYSEKDYRDVDRRPSEPRPRASLPPTSTDHRPDTRDEPMTVDRRPGPPSASTVPATHPPVAGARPHQFPDPAHPSLPVDDRRMPAPATTQLHPRVSSSSGADSRPSGVRTEERREPTIDGHRQPPSSASSTGVGILPPSDRRPDLPDTQATRPIAHGHPVQPTADPRSIRPVTSSSAHPTHNVASTSAAARPPAHDGTRSAIPTSSATRPGSGPDDHSRPESSRPAVDSRYAHPESHSASARTDDRGLPARPDERTIASQARPASLPIPPATSATVPSRAGSTHLPPASTSTPPRRSDSHDARAAPGRDEPRERAVNRPVPATSLYSRDSERERMGERHFDERRGALMDTDPSPLVRIGGAPQVYERPAGSHSYERAAPAPVSGQVYERPAVVVEDRARVPSSGSTDSRQWRERGAHPAPSGRSGSGYSDERGHYPPPSASSDRRDWTDDRYRSTDVRPPPQSWERDPASREYERDSRYLDRDPLSRTWEPERERERRSSYPPPTSSSLPAHPPYDPTRPLVSRITDPTLDERPPVIEPFSSSSVSRDLERARYSPPPSIYPPRDAASRVRPRSPSPRRLPPSDMRPPPAKRVREEYPSVYERDRDFYDAPSSSVPSTVSARFSSQYADYARPHSRGPPSPPQPIGGSSGYYPPSSSAAYAGRERERERERERDPYFYDRVPPPRSPPPASYGKASYPPPRDDRRYPPPPLGRT